MFIFVDLGDNTSENNSLNPVTNFMSHEVIKLFFIALSDLFLLLVRVILFVLG